MMEIKCTSYLTMEIKHPPCFSPYMFSVNKFSSNQSSLMSASQYSIVPSTNTLTNDTNSPQNPTYQQNSSYSLRQSNSVLSTLPLGSSDHPMEQAITYAHRLKIV